MNRRAILAGAASLPAISILTAEPDPIFAAIEDHRQLMAKSYDAYNRLGEEGDDIEERRPCPLVNWRGWLIGGKEIDTWREAFL